MAFNCRSMCCWASDLASWVNLLLDQKRGFQAKLVRSCETLPGSGQVIAVAPILQD